MKVRNGFVSNSSSSSFVIHFKGTEKQLKEKLTKIFDNPMPENYPIRFPTKGIGQTVFDYIGEEKYHRLTKVKDYLEECGVEDESECSEDQLKAINCIKNGGKIYYGGFPDDTGDDLPSFLCNADLHYEDEEIYIHQDGGY